MTDQRIPTEAELRLVAGVCNKFDECVFIEDGDLILIGVGLFNPLEDSNDTDWLVRAMCKVGWLIMRWQCPNGRCGAKLDRRDRLDWIQSGWLAEVEADTDRFATTFAIIDALAAEEKRDE